VLPPLELENSLKKKFITYRKVVANMNGFIILTSIIFLAYFIYKTNKNKIMKYILTPVISLIYGFMLLYVGMSINVLLFYILAMMPVIFTVTYIVKTVK
jgi:hypothetical protein